MIIENSVSPGTLLNWRAPLCCETIPCVIDSPSPEPCSLPDIIGKNIESLMFSGIPGPLSETDILHAVVILDSPMYS